MSAAISQAYWVCTVLPCIRIYIVVLTGKFFGFSFSCCQICTYGCTFWTILQTKLVGWDVVVICLLVLLFVLKWMIQGESFWLDILWRLCLRSFTGPAYQLRTVIDWYFFFRDCSDDPLWITLLYEDSFLIEFCMFKFSLGSHMQLGSRHTLWVWAEWSWTS